MSRGLALAFALLAVAAPLQAQEVLPGIEEVPATLSWRVLGGVWTTSSIGLDTGASLGLVIEGRRRVGEGPFLAGLRLGWSAADEATAAWSLAHQHGLVEATLGLEKEVGVARLTAQAGVGILGVHGVATRHQSERLEALGLTDVRRTGWGAGPFASLDLGVALQVRSGFCILLSAGPFVTAQSVDGAGLTPKVGLQSTLGVFRAL